MNLILHNINIFGFLSFCKSPFGDKVSHKVTFVKCEQVLKKMKYYTKNIPRIDFLQNFGIYSLFGDL